MNKAIPNFQSSEMTSNLSQQMQNKAIAAISSNPLSNGILLKGISLQSGSNTVNHKLGRPIQGWIVTRMRGNVSIYDTQDSNKTPNLTLLLTTSGAITVDLYVF